MPLSYIGFGGAGKQVRDFLHVDDLFDAVRWQLEHGEELWGSTFNIGGGAERSTSLQELTELCQRISGISFPIGAVPETRWGDVKLYVSDSSKFEAVSGWKPKKTLEDTMRDIHAWITDNRSLLEPILK